MDKIQSKTNKCVNCGGNLEFSPSLQMLCCASCKSTIEIDKQQLVQKHDYDESYNSKYDKNFKGYLKCDNCGATVESDGNNVAIVCPYCQTSLVVDMNGQTFKPDFIIPFKLDKEKASLYFQNGVKKKAFLPNAFKKKPEIDKIEAFYFPVFSFDENTYTEYEGKLEIDQTHRTPDGHTHTTTSYRRIGGIKQLEHKNVFVETSSQFNQAELNCILPYNTNELCVYDEKFLMGYSMEKLSTSLTDCKKIADRIVDGRIKHSILSGYSYDRVAYLELNTTRSEQKFAYGALPVYKLTTSYKDKNYSILLNGQTGKIGSGLPKSKVKMTFFVLSIILFFAIFVGIIIFASTR